MDVVVVGASGRMGRQLVRAVAESDGALRLVGALETAASPALGQDAGVLAGVAALGVPVTADVGAALDRAQGILDFTVPTATVSFARHAAERGLVHVIGTTGCAPADDDAIRAAAATAVIVKSGNMSLGVNLLAAVAKRVARALDPSFDIEIVEMHHRAKVDAPSGTALLLGQAAAAGRGVDLATHGVFTRHGHTGARPDGAIGFATLRGGSVVGDHTVVFAGAGERIELTHRADDRALFARGAVRAALWARGQAPGLYSMADVLGISDL